MRSQRPMISAMLWSISRTPASWSSRTPRTASAKSGTSASGKPGGRLVQQDEAWSGRKRARDAESPLVALRERVGGGLRLRAETQLFEQLGRPYPCFAGSRADAERRDLDVLAHRERPKGVTVLKRSRQALPAPAARAPVSDVAPFELDRPGRSDGRSR